VEGSRLAGVPGIGLERLVCAEGDTEADPRQAHRGTRQGARRRERAQAPARPRLGYCGQGETRPATAPDPGHERACALYADHQGGKHQVKLDLPSDGLTEPSCRQRQPGEPMISFTIRPLTDHTGSEVIGLDFTRAIDEETRTALNRILAARH